MVGLAVLALDEQLSLEGMEHVSPLKAQTELGEILSELEDFVTKYVYLGGEERTASVVLWVAHAHFLEAFETTPRLAILSTDRRCGKTRLLEILELLCLNAIRTANISSAALFRLVEKKSPVLLVDEVDTVFGGKAKDNEDLRGLFNSGHRRGAVVYRCDGPKFEIRPFKVFAATALAAIGNLPDTIADRSVILRMRRRGPNDRLNPFRRRNVEPQAERICTRLASLAPQVVQELSTMEAEIPDGITDRAADTWEPLLAIAEVAGGEWIQKARNAALMMTSRVDDNPASVGIVLLEAVRSVFEDTGKEQISSASLIERLLANPESRWRSLYGAPISQRSLAGILRPYEVHPRNLRIKENVIRGYRRSDFEDSWTRYLSATPATNIKPSPDPASIRSKQIDVADVAPDGKDDE